MFKNLKIFIFYIGHLLKMPPPPPKSWLRPCHCSTTDSQITLITQIKIFDTFIHFCSNRQILKLSFLSSTFTEWVRTLLVRYRCIVTQYEGEPFFVLTKFYQRNADCTRFYATAHNYLLTNFCNANDITLY